MVAAAPTFRSLNRRRQALGLSVGDVIGAAGIHPDTWGELAKAKPTTDARRTRTLARVAAGIEKLSATAPARLPRSFTMALVLAAEELLRLRIAFDPSLIAACNPGPRAHLLQAMPAGRLRTLALYLVAVELDSGRPGINAAIADALGCTRQNVKKARATVEAIREDGGALDRLLTSVADVLNGRAA